MEFLFCLRFDKYIAMQYISLFHWQEILLKGILTPTKSTKNGRGEMIEKFPTWLWKLLKVSEVQKLLVKSWKGCEYLIPFYWHYMYWYIIYLYVVHCVKSRIERAMRSSVGGRNEAAIGDRSWSQWRRQGDTISLTSDTVMLSLLRSRSRRRTWYRHSW